MPTSLRGATARAKVSLQNFLEIHSHSALFGLGSFAFVLSAAVTIMVVHAARRFALHAIPNERSSHTVPTPQLGGIGVAVPVCAFMLLQAESYGILAYISIAYFALGLYDDLRTLSPVWKLLGQFAAFLVPVYTITWGFGLYEASYHGDWSLAKSAFVDSIDGELFVVLIAYSIWFVGIINVFNFMDGMNGNAGVFAIIVLGTIAMLIAAGPDRAFYFETLALMIVTMAAIGGFLLFNCRPTAAVFLGDCGSHFIGAILAVATLPSVSSVETFDLVQPSFTFSVLVLFPFLFDASLTLVRRCLAGKPFWKAHREHLYQRLLVAGYSHMRVLSICLSTYIACAALAYLSAVSREMWVQWACLAAAFAVMGIYTAYVFRVEAKTARRPTESVPIQR